MKDRDALKILSNQVICQNNRLLDSEDVSFIETPLIQMLFVEGGTFSMNDRGFTSQASVSSFHIGKYPVTQREWEIVMDCNPSYFKGKDRPVEKISWFDAVAFCNRLSALEGFESYYTFNGNDVICNINADGYRLPAEAEWEFAARGGELSKGYVFSGSDHLPEVGWFKENAAKQSMNVGLNKANELGLYDMSGNVWEWCQDWYGIYPKSGSKTLCASSPGRYRVIRGGSWMNYADFCKVDYRFEAIPGVGFAHLGFRLVRSHQG